MDATGRAAGVYYALPPFLQNAALTALGARQARVRFGRAFRSYLAGLRASDHWGRDRVRSHQDAEIRRIVAHAYATTDYYRDVMDRRGLGPGDIRGAADLPLLPILTKDAIRQHGERLMSSTARTRRLHTIQTSGSTGAPMRIATPPEALAFKWATWWRHRERFGVRRKMRHLSVMSTPWVHVDRREPPYWRWNLVERQAFLPMQQIIPAKIGDVIRFLDEERFEFWAGYPSILQSLVIAADEAGLTPSHGPRMVFTGAESLFDHQRDAIAGFTGAVVSQTYGFNEAAGNATECEEGHLHEDFEFGYMECSQPEAADPIGGSRGPLLATGFTNTAMPLIRYEVGDVGTFRPDEFVCPCGRGSRVLVKVDGRLEDYVLTPEGHRERRVGDVFKGMPSIKQFQIVQDAPEAVLIRLAVRPDFERRDEELLRRRVAVWISGSLTVDFDYVDRIPPGPNGKMQRVVGLLSDER